MRRLLLGTAVIGLAVASCGGNPERPEAAALPDGRHFGYIEALDGSTLEFDAAEFLTGAEANEAALADGAIEAGETVPNDYYIRNPDRSVVELQLADDVQVTAVRCRGPCREGVAGDLEGLRTSFADPGEKTLADNYRGAQSQYWVTIAGGVVTAIDEQYLP